MEDNKRLRVKRIPLEPRQVKTYFGITSGSEYESDSVLDNEEEQEELFDDIEVSSSSLSTPIPSFHMDLNNSAFQSTTYYKSATSTPLTNCSTPGNYSTITEKTFVAKTSALTPALSAVPSFHCYLPPSPFYSTYAESRLATGSRMMEFEESDSETVELKKDGSGSPKDFGSKTPLATAETKMGERISGENDESMSNAKKKMRNEEYRDCEKPEKRQIFTEKQLEENPNALVSRCVDAQTSILVEMNNLHLNNTADQKVVGGQKPRYSLYHLSRVEDIGVQTSPFFSGGGCGTSLTVLDDRRKETVELLEKEMSMVEKIFTEEPLVLLEKTFELQSESCIKPIVELIDEIANEHAPIEEKKAVTVESAGSFMVVGATTQTTPPCCLESDYQRPHSPVSMSADRNESVRSFTLPSPIRPVLAKQQSRSSPSSTSAKRYIRPRISTASFTVANPIASQMQQLYASLKSPSLMTLSKSQRRFSKFATPSTTSTVSSPRRSSTSVAAMMRSPVVSPCEKLVARRATMPFSAFNNDEHLKATESPLANARKSLPAKSSTTLNNVRASNLALKSALKRCSNLSADSSSTRSTPNVLREIYVNYATPPSTSRDCQSRPKSVTFKNVFISSAESTLVLGRPSTTVTKTDSNRFSSIVRPLVDYNYSPSPSTTMADATNDSALWSPCAKQIVLKRGSLFVANNISNDGKDSPWLRVNEDSMLYENKEDGTINDFSSGYYGGVADDEEDSQLNSTSSILEAVMRSNTAKMGNISVGGEGANELQSLPFIGAEFDGEEEGEASSFSNGSRKMVGRQSFFNSSMFTTGGADESIKNYLSDENNAEGDDYLDVGNEENEEEDISSDDDDASPSQTQRSDLDESVRHIILKRGPVESPSYILKAPKIKCSSTDSPSAGILRRSKRHRVPRLPPGQEAVYKYGDNGTRTLVGVTDLVVRDKQLKKYRYVDPILAANEEWEAKHQKKVLKDKKKELRSRYNKVLN